MNTKWSNSARNLYNNNSGFQKNKRLIYSYIGTFFCFLLLGLGVMALIYSSKKKYKKNKKTKRIGGIISIVLALLLIALIWYNYNNYSSSPYNTNMLPSQNIYSTMVSSKRQL